MRDAGAVQMTDFEMLSLFPGLMLAGHETSSNLICTGLSHLLADPDRYAAAQRDDASRAAALEELFRFESAITGMKRLVTRDTELGGVPLAAGEQVFLAYASGSPRRRPVLFAGRHRRSTGRGRSPTSASARACTPASARRWPGCSCASSSRSCTSGWPTCGSPCRTRTSSTCRSPPVAGWWHSPSRGHRHRRPGEPPSRPVPAARSRPSRSRWPGGGRSRRTSSS